METKAKIMISTFNLSTFDEQKFDFSVSFEAISTSPYFFFFFAEEIQTNEFMIVVP